MQLKLSEKHIKLISEAATQAAIKAYKEETEREKAAKHDRRLRNIKLLLRNYRAFAKHCEDIKLEINQLDKKLQLDEIDTDEFAISSIKRSKERTLAMVKYINKTLEIYKILCDKSDDIEEKRRYQVVYDLYISDSKLTAQDVAVCHSVHLRTIYRDVDKACEALVVLMFGVDGVKFR